MVKYFVALILVCLFLVLALGITVQVWALPFVGTIVHVHFAVSGTTANGLVEALLHVALHITAFHKRA